MGNKKKRSSFIAQAQRHIAVWSQLISLMRDGRHTLSHIYD